MSNDESSNGLVRRVLEGEVLPIPRTDSWEAREAGRKADLAHTINQHRTELGLAGQLAKAHLRAHSVDAFRIAAEAMEHSREISADAVRGLVEAYAQTELPALVEDLHALNKALSARIDAEAAGFLGPDHPRPWWRR